MVPWHEVVAWAAAFVAIWWVADWVSMRQEGEPLPLRRDPGGLLAHVLRKLARNRSFVLALVGLWLLGAAIIALQSYLLRLHPAGTGPAPGPAITALGPLADAIPRLLAGALPESLPRLQPVPLTFIGEALLALLVIVAIVRLTLDPPAEMGAATIARLQYPGAALVAFVTAYIAVLTGGQAFLSGVSDGGALAPARSIVFSIIWLVLLPALLAPVVALLWRMVVEVVDAGAWSFRSALAAVGPTWLPVALVLMVSKALLPAVTLTQGPTQPLWGMAYYAVLVLLAFVPWAIVDRQAGLIDALRESWRLFRARWLEVIIFGLRFTLLFAALGGLVGAIEPTASARWQVWYGPLLDVLRNALGLLQVMTVAALYVHLRDEEAADACAVCAVAGADDADYNCDQAVPKGPPS
ncbi:MAG: hypothetical protein AB7Y46_10890 [Armatimonadota bacterium]